MAAELRESLLESMRYHLVADVPVGILLSAGVDSNVIAALASGLGQRLTAVTLAFEEYLGTAQDETELAKGMARQLGISHVTAIITREEFESLVDDFFDCMDQPTIDGLNMYLVSRAIAGQGFKVALCGLGGDELFAGYPSFRQINQILSFGWLFAPLRAVAQYVPVNFSTINRILRLSPKWSGVLSHSGNLAQLYILRRALHLEEEIENLLDKYWLDHGLHTILTSGMVVTLAQQLEEAALGRHAQISVLEMCAYMRSQLLRDADWASMSHGLEVRVPFVDAHLLQQLAPWIASAKPPTKPDLAGSVGQDMMKMLVNRGKTGFTTPVRDWAMSRSGNLAPGLRGWSCEVHRRFRLIGRDETAKLLTKQAA
jgi:asparagine synthase (glutamine-hydrolysing)